MRIRAFFRRFFVSSIWNSKSQKSQTFAADYRALMKSSETVESKGFFAICSPNPFINCYTILTIPAPLIRAKAGKGKRLTVFVL